MGFAENLLRAATLLKGAHDTAMRDMGGMYYDNPYDLPGPEEELSFVAGSMARGVLKLAGRVGGSPEGWELQRAIRQAQAEGRRFDPVEYYAERQRNLDEWRWNNFATPEERAARDHDLWTRDAAVKNIDSIRVNRDAASNLFEAAYRLVTVRAENSDAKYPFHSYYDSALDIQEREAYAAAARLQARTVEFAYRGQVIPFSKTVPEFLTFFSAARGWTPQPHDVMKLSNELASELGKDGEQVDIRDTRYTVSAMQRTNDLLHEAAETESDRVVTNAARRAIEETLQFASTQLWEETIST